MIVDTSALIAILTREPDAETFSSILADASEATISAGSHIECSVVLLRHHGPAGARRLDDLCDALDVGIVPVLPTHARIARAAYARYGRGTGSPARLNFGDCFAYALAIATDEPLLYKGDDFGHTDVRSALT